MNNVSITSDHNDDLEMREIAENVDGVDIGPKDDEEVLATENIGNSQADGSISEEFELVGGELEMNFEDDLDDEEETENANEKIKRKGGPNKEYVLVEEFEDKLKFDEYWNDLDFNKIYYHHVSKTTNEGMVDIFRCKNVSKHGFEKCEMQCKIVFPSCDMSVQLHITSDEHKHDRIAIEEHLEKFTWRTQPEAEQIVKLGEEHNDYPSQIMKALHDAGISPMPD